MKITKGELIQNVVDTAGIQTAQDGVPSQVSSTMVPTIIANPILLNAVDIVRTTLRTATSTNYTLYTVDSNKDFYLTHILMSWSTDAANDGVSAIISASIGGSTTGRNLSHLNKVTLTATSQAISQSFTRPIKIDKGTNIAVTAAFTAGTMSLYATIIGFYI